MFFCSSSEIMVKKILREIRVKKAAKILGFFGLVTPLLGLSPGEAVPNFSAKNQDGKVIQISEFRGKPVLLYFYPKDDTPGCTKEACSFRDEYSEFKKLGAVIFGVSRQDSKSHRAFKEKHRLPFDLLVDEDGSIAKSLGIGTIPLIGFHKRQSILIGPDGKVFRVYTDVDPKSHTQEVLKDLKSIQSHS
jgi:peroxiredoxin Q/BCP